MLLSRDDLRQRVQTLVLVLQHAILLLAQFVHVHAVQCAAVRSAARCRRRVSPVEGSVVRHHVLIVFVGRRCVRRRCTVPQARRRVLQQLGANVLLVGVGELRLEVGELRLERLALAAAALDLRVRAGGGESLSTNHSKHFNLFRHLQLDAAGVDLLAQLPQFGGELFETQPNGARQSGELRTGCRLRFTLDDLLLDFAAEAIAGGELVDPENAAVLWQ